ncbi:hypothetical protein ACLI1X_16800, partial [Enterococcus faecalis]
YQSGQTRVSESKLWDKLIVRLAQGRAAIDRVEGLEGLRLWGGGGGGVGGKSTVVHLSQHPTTRSTG